MSIHCNCWNDGEPCCWCLDDTEEEDGVELPACANTRTSVCVSDLRAEAERLEDLAFEAERSKAAAIAS